MSLAKRRRLMGEPLQEVPGLARSAMPPEPSGSNRHARRSTVRLPASISRGDVPAVVARCLEQVATGAALTADCSDLLEPRLPAIDAIARLALEAGRDARSFRLEHASPALLDLVRLCGLEDRLGNPEGARG